MPEVKIRYYRDTDSSVPVNDWLEELKGRNRIGYARCVAKIRVLAEMGLDARRPTVEYLRDGILELRAKHMHTQYRILFFYQNREVVILAHNLVKRGRKVPEPDIDAAIERKRRFETDPEKHTYEREEGH